MILKVRQLLYQISKTRLFPLKIWIILILMTSCGRLGSLIDVKVFDEQTSEKDDSSKCPKTLVQGFTFSCPPGVNFVDVTSAQLNPPAVIYSMGPSNTCVWASVDPSTGEILGTPNDDQLSSCTLEVTASDGTLSTSSSIPLSFINIAPTLTISDAIINEDSGLNNIRTDIEVQSSEENYGIYTLDNTSTTNPKCSDNGVLIIDSITGSINFTPATNFYGLCNVKVIFDDQNTSNNKVSAQFSLTVTNTNDSPTVSNSCSTSLYEDTNYNCSPVVSDPDPDSHTWTLDPSTTCSWASINSTTGLITGTPNDDQVGTCTIAYKANDGSIDSNLDSFIVTVNNVQPTLSIQPTSLNEDSGLTVIRLDADVQASDEGYGIYSLDTSTNPKCSDNGTVSIDSSTGAISYNPASNYYGVCNIKVVFDDQNSVNNLSNTEFALTVSNTNDAPTVSNSCLTTTNEDQLYSCTPSFSEFDTMDTMTWSLDSSNTCSWATINATTGTISGTPHDDQVGTCTIAFKANDGSVDSNVGTFSLTVANIQPTLSIANVTISEDDPLSVIRSDLEVQASDEGHGIYTLDNFTTTSPACSSNGSVSIDSTTGAVSYAPSLNYNGTCNIKVLFDDQNSINSTITAQFSVTVTPGNDAPTIEVSCLPSSSCGNDLIGRISATDGSLEIFDGDNDMSNSQICFMPSGSGYNIFKASTSSFPRTDYSTHTSLNLDDDDSAEQVLSGSVKMYGNSYPSIWISSNGFLDNLGDSDYSPSDNDFKTKKVIAPFWTDLNPSDQGSIYFKEESDRVIATWENVTEYGEANSNNAQVEIYKTSGEIIITFGNVEATDTTYVGISNGGGSISLFNYIGGSSTISTSIAFNEDTSFSCTPVASDIDGDTLTWSLESSTSCSWANINSTTGEITGTPNDDQVGDCAISFKVSDGSLSSSVVTDAIQVNNIQPTLSIANATMNEDGGLKIIRTDLEVQASDETWGYYDLDNITVSSPACDENGTLGIDPMSGQITFNPNLNYFGVCFIKVEFNDENTPNNIISAQFNLTVNNVNDLPVISSTCSTTTTEGSAYSCAPSLVDADLSDTQTWSFAVTNTCAWATIDSSTGTIGGVPNDDEVGTCTLSFKSNDGAADSNIETYTVTVNNGVPQLVIADAFIYQNSPATVIRTDAEVQSNNEGSGVYSLDNANTTAEKCSDHGIVSINTANGEITYAPSAGYTNNCHIKVIFDDEHATNNLISTEFLVTIMDLIGPSPISIDSTAGDLTYVYGQTVEIKVHFNEAVYVDTTGGVPKFKLETGTIDKFANYASGSGTTDLTFEYIVGIGDQSSDLDIHSTFNVIELSGGTIKDNFDNDIVSVTLPTALNINSLATKRNITIDTNIDYANFSGQPTRVSAAILLNIDVFGDNLTFYQYKIQATSSVDCSDSSGYSSDIDISTNITENISSYSNGTNMSLCIVGKNGTGNWQPYSLATQYNWTKDKYAITILDFTGISNIPTFKDASVAPNNDAIIYARNLKGEILRTTNSGSSWNVLCKLPSNLITDSKSNILVSAGDDYTAYITLNNDIYRADDLLGGYCLNMTSSYDKIYTDYIQNGLTLHPNKSELYAWTKIASGSKLMKSIDRGETWTTLINHTFYNGEFGTLAINPSNDQEMTSYRWNGNDLNDGLYFSTDSGNTWTFNSLFTPSGYTTPRSLIWNPLNTNYVYSNTPSNETPFYSANNGNSWANSFGLPSGVRWTIDGNGKVYYLKKVGFNTTLERSPAITTPATINFSTLYTFNNLRGIDNSSQSISVSNSGNTMAAVIENKLFISTDSGITFNEINWQGSKAAELHSVTTEDGGQTIYGVTPNWSVVKTIDGGQNWTYQYSYHNHCSASPRIRVSPVSSNNVLLWPDNLNSSTNCSEIVFSTDGMNSASFSTNGISTNYTQIAMSPVDQERFFYIGSNLKYRVTKDGGISWVENPSLWGTSFLPESYSHPIISDLVWVGESNSTGILWEYDTQNNSKVDITSRLGLSSFAGFNVVKSNGGQFLTRAISRTGVISESTDNGETFNPKATVSPLTSCFKRLFYTHPKDFNVVTTACATTNQIAFSRDAGTSWIQMDLNSLYGINCSIRGVAIHLSKLFIACSNSESLMLNYTPLELINDVYDGVLSSSEISNTNDLIVNINEAGFVSIEYAVIPAASVCNQTISTFSPIIPKSNNSAITIDGNYKVCAKLTDNLGIDFYESSSIFTVDTVVPTFSSIDLLDESSDGDVRFYEHYKNIKPLVGNLNASGHDTVLYSLEPSTTTCDNTVSYEQSIPSHYSKKLKTAGNYKVCVKLTDYAGHPDAYGESSIFNFSPLYAIAKLSGTPTRVTKDNSLNITVTGDIITKYKYKIGLKSSTNCNEQSGYSGDIILSTKITDDLTSYSLDNTLKLCVLGSNATDDWQPYQFASEYIFTYANRKIEYISSNQMNLPYWQDAAIAPSDKNIVYAKSLFNEIYKSTDGGINWELQCRINKDSISDTSLTGNLFVSKGADATAYLTTTNDLYRIERVHGDNCTNLTSGFGNMYNGTYLTRSATTDINGNLYFWEEKSGIGLNLWKSTDQGERFNLITTHTDTSGYFARMDIDPSNPNNMIVIRGQSTGQGIYKSTNGGVTWNFITASLYSEENYLLYLPGNSQYIFANSGYYSTNDGTIWNSGGTTNYITNYRFYLDGVSGYRFKDSGSGLDLQRAADLTTLPPSWSTLKTFSNGQFDHYGKAVSANSTKIAVVSEGRLHISNDTGATWNEIQYPNELLRASGFALNAGQDKIYAALQAMRLIASTDSGSTWNFRAALLESTLSTPGFKYSAVEINPNNENQINMFINGPFGMNYMGSSLLTNNDYATHQHNTEFSTSQYNTYGFDPVHSGVIHNYYPSSGMTTYSNFGSATQSRDTLINFPTSNSTTGYNKSISIFPSNAHAGIIFHSNKAYRYQTKHRSWREITSTIIPSVLPDIAGNEVFRDIDGQYKIRVISSSGKMAVSNNNGASWTVRGSTSPSIGSCSIRMIRTNKIDPKTILTYCPNGELVSISKDGGVSWDHINLSTYALNCDIGHVDQSAHQIFIGCTNDYGLILDLDTIKFTSTLNDAVLNSTELATSTELLLPIESPNFYSDLKYKIVLSSTICDASLTYSSIIPKSDASEFSTDNEYKICIELTDTLSNITYEASPTFTVDQTPPSFTSISLAGAAADGFVAYQDKIDDPFPIVENLIGSSFDYSAFVVVNSATTCDGTLTYSPAIPSPDSEVLQNSDTYKVCIRLTDKAGNTPAYGSSLAFTYDSSELVAQLNNLPDMITNISTLNINVTGPGITHYKYKIGISSLLNCADPVNYSSEVSIVTAITSSITGYAYNNSITICVIGTNGSNISQPFLNATSYTFVRNAFIMRYYNFTGVDFEVGWNKAEIAANDSSIIYAIDRNGLISKSVDSGATWEDMCKINPGSNGNLKVSKDGSKAYASDDLSIYFVFKNKGSSCKRLRDFFGSANKANFDIYPNGDLLILDIPYINGSKQYYFYKYSNDTQAIEILSILNTSQSSGNYNSGFISIDPINPNNIIWNNPYNVNWGWLGFNISNDGGRTWSSITSSSSSSVSYRYDPVNADYIYTDEGKYSNDGGYNFSTAAGYITSNHQWSMDQTGKAFHLKTVGSDTILETSPDMISPSWSDLTVFTGISSTTNYISSSGNTIAAIIGPKLYISTDAGVTFNEVAFLDEQVRTSTVDRVADTLYAGTHDWNFLKSIDNGATWTTAISASSPTTKPPYLRIAPSNVNQVNVMAQEYSSTNNNKSIFTHDGFTTMIEGTNSLSSYFTSMAISPTDENIIYFMGQNLTRLSTDAGANFSQVPGPFPSVWWSSYSGFVSPIDNDIFYVAGSASLWEYDHITKSRTDIKSRLSFVDPAGLDMYFDGTNWVSVVISNYGVLNESNDNLATFTPIGNAATHFMSSCSTRHFKVLQEDPQVMVTACIQSNTGAYTTNGGMTWVEFVITNSLPIPASCTIGDIEVYNDGSNNHAIISCKDINALEILF